MSAMTLLSSYLDDGGWHTEAENVRNGVDLESYENELSLIGWLLRHASLTQSAQSVDVDAACMSMYPDWSKYHQHERETFRKEMKQAITRAIGNAQADD